MGFLAKNAIKRPVSIFLALLALLVFGTSSVLESSMELIPDIEMPMLIVFTQYTGAPPEDIEKLISDPIESAVSAVNGIKNITSQSMEHASMIMLEFQYGTNMDDARADVKNYLDMVSTTLPDSASDPTVVEISMSMMPCIVLTANATGDVDLNTIVDDEILPKFERLSGVASVSMSGGEKNYISVCLDENKVKQYNLSLDTIAQCIGAADFTLPVGSLGQGDIDLTVRGGVSYPTAESLNNIPLTLMSGDVIHLSDLATVSYKAEDASTLSRFNGNEVISLSITKRQSASTVKVTRAATKLAEKINAENYGVQMNVIYDSSDTIIQALSSLFQALGYGVAFAMLILFIFFGDWRASLIVGTSIPVSLLITICAMAFMGFSMNMMTVGGLVIGVGMMVDNSIVVIESIFRMRESGMELKDAAIEGTNVVGSSIFGGTLTTVVVFLPIAFLSDMSGQLFKQLCFTIMFSLIASLLSAVTLAPLVFYRVAPAQKDFSQVTKILNKLYAWYTDFLPKALNKRKLVALLSVVLLIASFCLIPFIGIELLPETDEGQITISVETRPGLSNEALDKKMQTIEEIVTSIPDVEKYSMTSGGSGVTSMMGTGGGNSISVYLKENRAKSTKQIIDQLREETKDIIDCNISISNYSTTSLMTGGNDITITLESDSLDNIKDASNIIINQVEKNKYVVSASSSLSSGTPQAEVNVDPIKSGAYGLVPASVLGSVYKNISGSEATTMTVKGVEYSVKVEYPKDTYENISDLDNMLLTAPSGMQVALKDIATIEYSDSPESIVKYNGMYQTNISIAKKSNAPSNLSKTLTDECKKLDLPEGVNIVTSSMDESTTSELMSIVKSIITATFLVFLVMAMQFESPRQSLIIMITIPFALIGSFLVLFITRSTLNMPSLMGFLMLVGTVVNSGILFIDTANDMIRNQKINKVDALVQSGILRMRPIFMTTLTTILAMVPTAVSSSGNGVIMSGMAWVIIGGLTASTILTLLLLPSFYILFGSKLSKEEKEEIRLQKAKERLAKKNK